MVKMKLKMKRMLKVDFEHCKKELKVDKINNSNNSKAMNNNTIKNNKDKNQQIIILIKILISFLKKISNLRKTLRTYN